MNRELTVRVVVGERQAHALLVGLLLALFPQALGSETVTLQTYYPSPFGIYTQLRTTNQTVLVENSGQYLGIGKMASTTAPVFPKFDMDVDGQKVRFANSETGPVYVAIGEDPGTSHSNGTGANTYALAVKGKTYSNSYVYAGDPGCTVTFGDLPDLNHWTMCPAGSYATWVPGVYSEGMAYQSRITAPDWSGFYGMNVWGYADGEGPAKARWFHFNYRVLGNVQFLCCPK